MATNEHESMTDERLAEIRELATNSDFYTGDHDDLIEVLAEVERLRAALNAQIENNSRIGSVAWQDEREQYALALQQQNTDMRAIVEAVATLSDEVESGPPPRRVCDCRVVGGYKLHPNLVPGPGVIWSGRREHTDDCLVTQARAFVAQHPAQEA